MSLKEVIILMLKDCIHNLELNKCEMTEEDIYKVLKEIAHIPMSKSDAYNYMGVSRTTFDYRVSKGDYPQGMKRKGFNELVWYKDQLDSCKANG